MINYRSKILNLITNPLAIILSSGFVIILFPLTASAQVDLGMDFVSSLGLPDEDIRVLVSNIIRSFLGLIGFITVLMIISSGFKYMTHGNNEEAKTKAVGGIKNAVIGLIIMLISFSAARFIINTIVEATGSL